MDSRFDACVVPMTNPTGVGVEELGVTRLCGAHMKGFAIMHLMDVMTRENAAYVDAWRSTWPEPHRTALLRENLRSSQWLPVEYYFHGIGWLAKQRGNLREAIAIGYDITEADISSFFRFVASMASPATVLALAQRFWSSYFDRSTVHITNVGSNGAVIEIRDWPLEHDTISLHELAGAFFAFGDASRAKDFRVSRVELTRPGQFTFAVAWR